MKKTILMLLCLVAGVVLTAPMVLHKEYPNSNDTKVAESKAPVLGGYEGERSRRTGDYSRTAKC